MTAKRNSPTIWQRLAPKITVSCLLASLLAGCSSAYRSQLAEEKQASAAANTSMSSKPSELDLCKPAPGSPFAYKKTVFVAGTTETHDLAPDLPGLAEIVSQQFSGYLSDLDRFILESNTNARFDSDGPDLDRAIRYYGQNASAQFIVKLALDDLSYVSDATKLPDMLKTLVNPASGKRRIEVSLYIYDVKNETLFYSKQYEDLVQGKVIGFTGSGSRLTPVWFATDLGQSMDEILKAVTADINEKLACIPFSTEVSLIEGDNIFIQAGNLQGLRPKSRLRLYQKRRIIEQDGTRKIVETPASWITIQAVYPDYSIARIEEQNPETGTPVPPVRVGDSLLPW